MDTLKSEPMSAAMTDDLLREFTQWVDDNWGLDRGQPNVCFHASRLTVNVTIIDKNGKPDYSHDLLSMRDEMKYAMEDLLIFMQKFIVEEPTHVTYAGNQITLEYFY